MNDESFGAARRILDGALRTMSGGAVAVRHVDKTTTVYGSGKPYILIKIREGSAYRRLLGNPALTVGEAYSEGLIRVEGGVDQLARFVYDASHVSKLFEVTRLLPRSWTQRSGDETPNYTPGLDFYRLWLDDSLSKSVAYYPHVGAPLEQAQIQKRRHLLNKLDLQPGQRVLEIGAGLGVTLVEAAQNFGVSGVGLVASDDDLAFAQELATLHNVEQRVEFRKATLEEIANERFDAAYTTSALEHVERRELRPLISGIFDVVNPGGVVVAQTTFRQQSGTIAPWIERYITPNSYIPTAAEVFAYAAEVGFQFVHAESLRMHGAMTFKEWLRRYEPHRSGVANMFDDRFVRIWEFYLNAMKLSCAFGYFDVQQMVFARGMQSEPHLSNAYMYQ